MEEEDVLIVQITTSLSSMNLEDDDENDDSILVEQGNNYDEFPVAIGEQFKIDAGYEGSISCETIGYKFINKFDDMENRTYKIGATIELESGEYLFHKDGVTIEKI
jgi:hypothetical protein